MKGKDKGVEWDFKESLQRVRASWQLSQVWVYYRGYSLNHLNNITIDTKYATICGYTQEEFEEVFGE